MRIISQSGLIDIPYKTAIVKIMDYGTYFANVAITQDGTKTVMAEYSTQEKALKAMEKLHEAYCGVCILKNKQPPEMSTEEFRKAMNSVPLTVRTCADPDIKVITKCAVFRFPQDDEVQI